MSRGLFPNDFLWGVATSAFQIEGATEEDGRGESIWDRLAAQPGAIVDGTDARVACDHYHRWREDVERLKWLGVHAYRLSIAWPRVLPLGTGRVNGPGLDFYDGLVDGLLEAGIRPFVTLYHWDLPQALQDRGGWGDRAVVDAFVNYAEVVAARLGDRVKDWVTHNEPWCISTLGHEEAHHAPAHRDPREAMRVAHHVLLSHGRAVEVIRRRSEGARVGIVLNLTPAEALTDDPADLDAARWYDGFFNRWYLDPLYRGEYPADAVADRAARGHLTADLPFVHAGDMEEIAVPTDFLGVNYYGRAVMRAGKSGKPESVVVAPREELTDMGWEDYPTGLRGLLDRLQREYTPRSIYITENGAAYSDAPDATDRVADTRRIEFHAGHLKAALGAIEDGVPLAGYFAWSLLDNFEWAHGYEKRFGLFWVDYATQNRIPKDSAHWYRDVIAANTVLDAIPQTPGGGSS